MHIGGRQKWTMTTCYLPCRNNGRTVTIKMQLLKQWVQIRSPSKSNKTVTKLHADLVAMETDGKRSSAMEI